MRPERLVVPHRNTKALRLIDNLNLPTPSVMGVLNVTPDSFSDGGRYADLDSARRQAERMALAGASIIDIGGESTRPGADPVSESEEIERVIPVIDAVRSVSDVVISIDTSKPAVMRAAVSSGAGIINDVMALQEAGALAAAADLGVAVCLMHMQGRPRTMQASPHYDDVVTEVGDFLSKRINHCVAAGIDRDRIMIDPGFGFGKTRTHNIELLANLRQLTHMGLPMLVGLSRKATLGELTGKEVTDRMPASVAAAVIAVLNGASIVRAHDVGETVDALRVVTAVMEAGT